MDFGIDMKKLRHEFVARCFEERGCKLLSKYESHSKPMRYICKCGRESMICFKSFKRGSYCADCAGRHMHTHDEVIEAFQSRGCELLDIYKDNSTPMKFKCKCGKRCRSALTYTLKATKQKKTNRTRILFGYTCSQLSDHITNHPNWNSVKDTSWHLDHIFPIKAFLEYFIKDIALINCLENLRPLSAKQNLKKSAKYDKVEFEKWLKAKGVNF